MANESTVLDTPAADAPPPDSTPKAGWGVSDHSADIDKYFAEDAAKEAPPKEEVVPPVKVEDVVPPKRTSLADALVEKHAAPPAKKEEATPIDPLDEIDAQMTKANPKWKPNEGWAKLKTIAKTESQKRAELETKLAETEGRLKALPVAEGMTADEVKKLREEHKAYSDRVMLLDLQSHPTFRAQFVEPRDAEISRAKELLDAHGVKGDVAALLGKGRAELGKAVEELTKDLPSFDRTEIAEAVRKAYSLEQNSKIALANSKELMKGIQLKTHERQKAAFDRRFIPVSQQIAQNLVKLEAAPDASPEERAEVDAYIQGGKNIRAQAEKYAFAVADDEQAAEIAMKAAAYDFHVGTVQPRLSKEVAQIVADNKRLAEELKALRSRNPNKSITPNSQRDDTAPKSMAEMSHAEAADHIARGGT